MNRVAFYLLSGDCLALAFVLGWLAIALKRTFCRWWSECLDGQAKEMR